jgi:ABC-type sulfate transport system permease component
VQIFSNIESDRPTAAAALSVVLLVFSFLTLLAIDLVRRWGSKHES